ncbi:EKC/KEOPS complex subunit LAGE3-like [Nannospalax galili]|uniref:L antigen family member 3 n=1 Tax=Nannospalax galili TaxID=1026970 RepID=A0A8C6S2V5_NANGA|nr:EKC/KEOPS complex subunit LAGE3-like [Nannospalax galili]
MQNPGEGAADRASGEEGEDGQRRSRSPDAQASSQSSAPEGSHGNLPQPSGGQASGSQAAPSSPSPGHPVGSGAAVEEAAAPPEGEQAPLVPGPSGDTATATRNRLLEFSVAVPFRSPVEADMARRSLIANAQRQQVTIQPEFTVNDSTLTVRWTTEDPVLFRIYINAFLEQLALVMRNIQRLELVAVVKRGRGRSNKP